jgi:hypothetical protein
MKKYFSLVALCGCLFAGQVGAAVYLPTVAYSDARRMKTEYTYDNYGHTLSEKVYSLTAESGQYLLNRTTEWEYQALPNGEFAVTKHEVMYYDTAGGTSEHLGGERHLADYDSRGMNLFNRYEVFNPKTRWVLEGGDEAIVDGNGIRTGIKIWNDETGALEVNPHFLFDNLGRVLQTPTNASGTAFIQCTWGEELHALTSMHLEGGIVVTNIVPRINLAYFNPYRLSPIDQDVSEPIGRGLYAWEDYKRHTMWADMDVSLATLTGAYSCTITDSEWSQTLTLGGQVVVSATITLLPNGGWQEESFEGTDASITRREYDAYGALTRFYDLGHYYGPGGLVPREETYSRDYDAQGRPTRTVKTMLHGDNRSEDIEEYEDWVEVRATGMQAPERLSFSVYPNPAAAFICIDLVAPDEVVMTDLSGRVVLQQTVAVGERIPVASLASGVYLLTLRKNGGTVRVIKR